MPGENEIEATTDHCVGPKADPPKSTNGFTCTPSAAHEVALDHLAVIAALKKALKPFAALAQRYPKLGDEYPLWAVRDNISNQDFAQRDVPPVITVGDLRAAARAIQLRTFPVTEPSEELIDQITNDDKMLDTLQHFRNGGCEATTLIGAILRAALNAAAEAAAKERQNAINTLESMLDNPPAPSEALKELFRKGKSTLFAPDQPVFGKPLPIATAPQDGTDILILANGMWIQARFAAGEWSEESPLGPAEYSGPVWCAFDDAVQFEIEEGGETTLEYHHGVVTHWMPLPPTGAETSKLSTGLTAITDHGPDPVFMESLRDGSFLDVKLPAADPKSDVEC